jgi:hypothetical protein
VCAQSFANRKRDEHVWLIRSHLQQRLRFERALLVGPICLRHHSTIVAFDRFRKFFRCEMWPLVGWLVHIAFHFSFSSKNFITNIEIVSCNRPPLPLPPIALQTIPRLVEYVSEREHVCGAGDDSSPRLLRSQETLSPPYLTLPFSSFHLRNLIDSQISTAVPKSMQPSHAPVA